MGSNQFYLKWKNYHESLVSSFGQLLSEETMVDVTLSCEGKKLKAHKIILCAGSAVFQNLLKDNPSQHPIIFMQETKYPDLKSIIDFIYKGQVCIYQDQLSTLLKTAEALKIRGLVNPENNESATSNVTVNNTFQNVSTPNSSKRKRKRKKSSSDSDSLEELPSKLREPETPNLVIQNTSSLANASKISNANVSQSRLKNKISVDVDSDADCSIVDEVQVKKEEAKAKFVSSTPVKSSHSVKVKKSPAINNQANITIDQKYKANEAKAPENLGISPVNQTEVTSGRQTHQSSVNATPKNVTKNEHQNVGSASASSSNTSEKSGTKMLTAVKDISQLTSTPSSRSPAITDDDPDPPALTPEGLMDAEPNGIFCDENSVAGNTASLSEPNTSLVDKDAVGSTNPDTSQVSIKCISDTRKLQCNVCQKKFSSRSTLFRHRLIHTGEKPYQCDKCKHSFRHRTNLIRHLRIHTGEKPFKCDICKRNFTRKGHLINHIRTHTGEKPFKCDICKQSFTQQGHLISHNRIHTGEKPFQCYICKRSFTQKQTLKMHARTHTREKPF